MWYDKYPGVPLRGSPLETLFVLVALQRRESELLATKALVLSSLAEGNEEAKNAVSSFKSYCDTMFPFLKLATENDKAQDMARLLEHVKHPIRIDIQAIKRERAEQAQTKALAKYRVARVEIPGIKRT